MKKILHSNHKIFTFLFINFIFTTFFVNSTFSADKNPSKTTIEINVKGRIFNQSNSEPIAGASIRVKGTNKGTTTLPNGNFAINVPNANSVLVISFIGFETIEYPLKGQNVQNLSIGLVESDKSLDEVVVVGYGEIRKSDLTGAVSKLKYAEEADQPVTSVD